MYDLCPIMGLAAAAAPGGGGSGSSASIWPKSLERFSIGRGREWGGGRVEGGKNRGRPEERDTREEAAGTASPPSGFHSLWVKFSGNTPLVEFSLFCCQSSCFMPISQPSSCSSGLSNRITSTTSPAFISSSSVSLAA